MKLTNLRSELRERIGNLGAYAPLIRKPCDLRLEALGLAEVWDEDPNEITLSDLGGALLDSDSRGGPEIGGIG